MSTIEKPYSMNVHWKQVLGSIVAVAGVFGARAGRFLGCTLCLYSMFLHLVTVALAYNIQGGSSAALTFFLPPFSEIYWLIDAWKRSGPLDIYPLTVFGFVALAIAAFALHVCGLAVARKGFDMTQQEVVPTYYQEPSHPK